MECNPNNKVFDLDSDECTHESNVKEANNEGYFQNAGNYVYMAEKYLGCAKVTKLIVNDIKIPNGFKGIKSIIRKIRITDCNIMGANLFVEGCILESITYICNNKQWDGLYENNLCDIKNKIPFNIACYLGENSCLKMDDNKLREYSIYCDELNDTCCNSGRIGEHNCEMISKQHTILNQFPYGKLNSYSITVLSISRSDRKNCSSKVHFLNEKISLSLFIDIFIKDKFIINKSFDCNDVDDCTCFDDYDERQTICEHNLNKIFVNPNIINED